MPIPPIHIDTRTLKQATSHRPYQGDQSFAALLDRQEESTKTLAPQGVTSPARIAPQTPPDQQPQALIPLGTVNSTSPSVSHLLQNHPTLKHECWHILSDPINRDKPFTSLPLGTEVSLNPQSREIVLGSAIEQGLPVAYDLGSAKNAEDDRIELGTITPDTPTVSHLLIHDPRFASEAWNIIFSPTNQEKPYASLLPGTTVAINPQTRELSFMSKGHDLSSSPAITAPPLDGESGKTPPSDPEQIRFSGRLAESVRSYMGQPYDTIDCYGLVVRGLKDQGVQYGGPNGLRHQLERLAQEQGLPTNALQNGEGLIAVAGNKLYGQSFVRVTNVEEQTREVLRQLGPLLQEGMLLSFSTPSQGHTGVIARKDDKWTYVNSGLIDHQVDGGRVSRRVGEETLGEEIKNWLQLAKNKKTSLTVSAGLFDTKKLKTMTNLASTGQVDTEPSGVKGDG